MRLLGISPSANPKKRYTAICEVDNGKTKKVNFGDPNMESYVMHHDKDRRDNYRSRHARDLRTNDPMRPGYLSYYILWGDSKNIKKNILAYKNEFDL